jgi:LCP family protein required for cell wall assembly
MDRNRILKIVLILLAVMLVLVILGVIVYMLWEKAPETAEPSPTATLSVTAKPQSAEGQGEAFNTQRKDGVYTVLLAGNDDGTGNTDTIMVAKLDTVRHTLDMVSIPRDTIINVDWENRKINSVYWGSINNGGNGIDALRSHIKNLVGFDVDCYAVIDLDVLIEAVDAMGGVYYDVPYDMDYDDGPVIHLKSGYQLLDGYSAMGLCRYRSGYLNGDLERIEVQHQFLKAVAEQFVTLGNVPNMTKVARLLSDNMDTNLSAANIAYFIRQVLMCKPENINFYTAPNTPQDVHELSYTFIDLYNWLDMVNTDLNPYKETIGEGDLDLVYLYNGAVCCTTALNGASYYQLGQTVTTEAAEEPLPVSVPAPTVPLSPSPSPSSVPTPSDEDWLSFN